MSAVAPEHVHDSSPISSRNPQPYRVIADAVPHSHLQMEQVADSRPARGPTTGDISRNAAIATTQTTAVDDASSPGYKKNGLGGPQQMNKRSLDYVLRSGLAGGVAGCAVSYNV